MLVDGLPNAGRLADWLTCYPKGGRGLDCQEEYRHHLGSPSLSELIISKFILSHQSWW